MGWFSKIFKGSDLEHKVSEGQYDWRYGAEPVENNPSTAWDSWSEMEDIDRAIALSLSEEEQKGTTIIDSEPQLEEDELLARAIQESLNVESPAQPSTPNDSPMANGYGHGNAYGHGQIIGQGHGHGHVHGHGNGYGHVNGHGHESLYQPISFPNSISLRISGCCKSGSTSDALKLLGRMTKEGIGPSVITYSVFLSSFSQQGNVKEYTKFLDEMKKESLAADSIRHCTSFEGSIDFSSV